MFINKRNISGAKTYGQAKCIDVADFHKGKYTLNVNIQVKCSNPPPSPGKCLYYTLPNSEYFDYDNNKIGEIKNNKAFKKKNSRKIYLSQLRAL